MPIPNMPHNVRMAEIRLINLAGALACLYHGGGTVPGDVPSGPMAAQYDDVIRNTQALYDEQFREWETAVTRYVADVTSYQKAFTNDLTSVHSITPPPLSAQPPYGADQIQARIMRDEA